MPAGPAVAERVAVDPFQRKCLHFVEKLQSLPSRALRKAAPEFLREVSVLTPPLTERRKVVAPQPPVS